MPAPWGAPAWPLYKVAGPVRGLAACGVLCRSEAHACVRVTSSTLRVPKAVADPAREGKGLGRERSQLGTAGIRGARDLQLRVERASNKGVAAHAPAWALQAVRCGCGGGKGRAEASEVAARQAPAPEPHATRRPHCEGA